MTPRPCWNIIETHVIEERTSAAGTKFVNNYELLRTLGHGQFAKVKLCERHAAAPAVASAVSSVATANGARHGDSTNDNALSEPPPPPPPLPALFAPAAPPPPPSPPRRQFALKIFSKKNLLKMKEYVTEHVIVATEDTTTAMATATRMRVVTALDRVQDEVRIMRSLYHRNVVLLFEVIQSEDSDRIYLVLEYMAQGPCMRFRSETKDFISPLTQSVLPERLARSHLRDVLHGLEYLHHRGICHRDLKPDNILLNATNRCHLMDFGCALMAPRSDQPLLVSDTVGTYQFVAPECCSGEAYDPFRVDIWAVGVLLYIFLFGRLPFQAEGTKELFDEIVRCEITLPMELRPGGGGISAACEELLLRLLDRDPLQRISIAEALQHPWIVQEDDADEDEGEEPLSF